MQRIKDKSAGMALVEAAVAVLVLGVIVAGSMYVINHRPASSSSTTNTVTAQPGTTASIDQLTQNDAQTEQQASTKADAQVQQDALSANSATSNVGGAYNESTL